MPGCFLASAEREATKGGPLGNPSKKPRNGCLSTTVEKFALAAGDTRE